MMGWSCGSVEGGRNATAFWKEHLLEKKMKGGMYFKEARIDSRLSNSAINTIVCYQCIITCQKLNFVTRESVYFTQTVPGCDGVSF
jgi:hypothetical protein